MGHPRPAGHTPCGEKFVGAHLDDIEISCGGMVADLVWTPVLSKDFIHSGLGSPHSPVGAVGVGSAHLLVLD